MKHDYIKMGNHHVHIGTIKTADEPELVSLNITRPDMMTGGGHYVPPSSITLTGSREQMRDLADRLLAVAGRVVTVTQ